jgi:hypothetical protein
MGGNLAPRTAMRCEDRQSAWTSAMTSPTEAFASPNSSAVFSL